MLKVKGIIHCHTTLSYDGTVNLADLCALLRQEGFDFVALTEHTKGLEPSSYLQFVRACRDLSSDRFTAVPGLEFRCGDGQEIAGIGVEHWLDDKPSSELTPQIRCAGGFAVWVHPFKAGIWTEPFLDCDAVEVMNGKLDGVLSPNLPLLKSYRRQHRQGNRPYAIFGLDFHNLRQARNVWIECWVEELTAVAIVQALREGKFVSRVPCGEMSSTGEIRLQAYFQMLILRISYQLWGRLLHKVPVRARNSLLKASRPIVSFLKRRRS